MAGWLAEPSRAEHVGFGSVLGSDRKMLRTRAGSSILLDDLLDEAVERAGAVVVDKASGCRGQRAGRRRPGRRDRRGEVRRPVERPGQGLRLRLGPDAVPERQHRARTSSTPMPGSARSSVVARCSTSTRWPPRRRSCREPAERALALHLLGFERAVRQTAELLEPHRLAGYLFELAVGVHVVLRRLPRAEGRRPRGAPEPPAAVRPHRPGRWPSASACSASRPPSACELPASAARAEVLPV